MIEENFDKVSKKVKAFGSLDSAPTLPTAQNLQSEKTYKLYIGGKQVRPDTQASRSIYLPQEDKSTNRPIYCLLPDASRKDVRNAVEAAQGAFSSWWKRSNFNKSQIIYYFGENFASRSKELCEKLELFTRKSKVECEREIKQCSDVIFHFASVCDKYIGTLNVRFFLIYFLDSYYLNFIF